MEVIGKIVKAFIISVKTILIILLSLTIGMACDNINDFGYPLISGQVTTPTFSLSAGTYTSAQTVTISTTTSGATIRYSTDGTTPTSTTGTVYSSAIAISTTTTINAIAYTSGLTDSSVASTSYTIGYASTQPDAVSGIQLWLKADSIAQTDGTAVNTWTDSSGSGNNVTAGTAPIYKTNILNGQPVVRFDGDPGVTGNGSHLTLGANYLFSTNNGITIFAVVQSNATTGCDTDFVFDIGLSGPAGYGFTYCSGSSFYYTPSGSGGAGPTYTIPTATTDYSIMTMRVEFNNEERMYLNGTSIHSYPITTLSQLTTAEVDEFSTRQFTGGPVTIGGQAKTDTHNGRFLNGDLAELVWYDTALSDADRQGVECYLSNKYGIAVSQTCQ